MPPTRTLLTTIAAVGLAALQSGVPRDLPAPVALIVSGGNVATSVLADLLTDQHEGYERAPRNPKEVL